MPSSFPRKEFEKAIALQPIINRLMHNVAHDEEFITTTLAETIKVDEFTANLFNIYRKVLAHGFTQVRQTACICVQKHIHTPTLSHVHASSHTVTIKHIHKPCIQSLSYLSTSHNHFVPRQVVQVFADITVLLFLSLSLSLSPPHTLSLFSLPTRLTFLK